MKRLQELHTQLRQTSEALVEHVDKSSFATPQDLAKVGCRAPPRVCADHALRASSPHALLPGRGHRGA